MRIKIRGGTVRSGENLCLGCTHYNTRTDQNGKTVNICTVAYYSPQVLTAPIAECNKFYPKNLPDLGSMTKIAWIVRTSSSGQSLGFMPPKDYKEKHGEVETPDIDD